MRKILINLFVLMLLSSTQLMATGVIKGVVYDAKSNEPIPFAKVSCCNAASECAIMLTDINGVFEFTDVAEGKYSLLAEAVGYENTKIENIEVAGKALISKTIKLRHEVAIIKEIIVVEDDAEMIDCDMPTHMSLEMNGTQVQKSSMRSYLPHTRQESFNTEQYDLIHENGYLSVHDHPLSTFSVDVDRASYANVRRFLNNKQMPAKDAVRIEEMINYFNYAYEQPNGSDPFSINMEMSKCPWNSENDLLLIGLKGKELTATEAPASNLVFLIDVSGSMNASNKLPLLKSSFKILVDNLRVQDKVAIVVYAGAAGLVLNSVDGNDKAAIYQALDKLSSGGSTAGGAGIRLAYNVAQQNYIPNGNNRVILATDGDFNIGESSDAAMVRLIEEKRELDIFLTALGFGMGNYKDAKMEKISNAGNGNYAYIDNVMEARKVFGTELFGTLFTIAKDVKFQIEFNPAQVKAYRLIGYENRLLNKEDFNDDAKDAGDIGAGHTVTALYELVKANSNMEVSGVDRLEYQLSRTIKSDDLMTVKLRYKLPESETSKLIRKHVTRSEIYTELPKENFLFASSVAGFGMLLRDSEYSGNLSYKSILAMLKQAKGDDEFGYRSELINLVNTANALNARYSNLD